MIHTALFVVYSVGVHIVGGAGDLVVPVQLGQHRLDVLHTMHLRNVRLCVGV